MGKHAFTIVIAVIIAVSLLLHLFMFQVRSNEQAVVLTFGKPAAEPRLAGYHFQAPWPIQDVRKFDSRLHIYEGLLEEVPTKDKYNIIAAVCVGWKIGDVFGYNKNFGRLDGDDGIKAAWEKVNNIVRHHVNAEVGQVSLKELVSLDKERALRYGELEGNALKHASADAMADYGIEISLLKIKRLELPDSVKTQVYNRMREERTREAQAIRSKGTEKAAAIKAQAESEAEQLLYRARATAEDIKTEGEVEAAKYYEVFKKNPELAIYLRQIRAFREIAAAKSTFVLDTRTAPMNILVQEPPKPEK